MAVLKNPKELTDLIEATKADKLPWSLKEYETWIDTLKQEKRGDINRYLDTAALKWHQKHIENYDNSILLDADQDIQDNIFKNLKSVFSSIDSIVFCARGGAAFACDLAIEYLKNIDIYPINTFKYIVNNDCQNINYDKKTLYFFVSYSGTTEEVINSYSTLVSQADDNKPKIQIITSISEGEKYGDKCVQNKFRRIWENDRKRNPNIHIVGVPKDRLYRDTHSLQPYVLFTGIIKAISCYLEDTNFDNKFKLAIMGEGKIEIDNDLRDKINTEVRIASQTLDGYMPYIYYDKFTYIIAERMQHVINENSKILSATDRLSEIQHNHIIPWTQGLVCCSIPIFIPSDDLESIKNMRVVMKKLTIERSDIPRYTVKLFGKTKNEQLFNGLYFADLLSIRMAILNNIDPSDNLKIYSAKNYYSSNQLPECGDSSSMAELKWIKSEMGIKHEIELTKNDVILLKKDVESINNDLNDKLSRSLEALERRMLQTFAVFVTVITLSITIITSGVNYLADEINKWVFFEIIFAVSVAIISIFILLFILYHKLHLYFVK